MAFELAIALTRLRTENTKVAGLKRYELGAAIGLDPSIVTRLQSGERHSTKLATLLRLCALAGITLPELLRLGGASDEELALAGMVEVTAGPQDRAGKVLAAETEQKAKKRHNGGGEHPLVELERLESGEQYDDEEWFRQGRPIIVVSPKPKRAPARYTPFSLVEGGEHGRRLLRTMEGPEEDGGRREAQMVPA